MKRGRTLSIGLHDWPELDRAGWQRALAPSRGLYDAGGAAERRSPRGLDKVSGGYAAWLSFLRRRGELDPVQSPAARVTPARLDAWIDEQRARGVRDSTIHSRLRDLHGALRLIEPGVDVDFIIRPRGFGLRRALPPVPKPFSIVESGELLRRALELFEAGRRGERYAGGAAAIRDAALLGLLAAHAPRIGSIAAMRVGVQLRRTGEGYTVDFGEEDIKTRRRLSYDLHPALVPVFDVYVADARPALGGSGTETLWCGTKERALGVGGLSKIVFRRTREWLGVAHGPHWFRKCLRTTAARYSPEAALDAAALLGHGAEVSVRHYMEAGATAALERHAKRIAHRRERGRLLAERFFAEGERARRRLDYNHPASDEETSP
ncbi:hypothetical protein [Falsiroseomonas oryziterrae]|uniref:hypothetical protein n=1 Tax=Falsiroseomonas oryziterrae TaxID=2911368 RepID=UPI001F3BCC83|nr:hypothetical protein [Roseomonas sp. NPKOSM-4]